MTHNRTGSDRYRWYVLVVLGLVSVANYEDRNLISILVQPVEQYLHVVDSQMGLLLGIAFAVAYSLISIPGAPGLLLAGVLFWTVKEPQRSTPSSNSQIDRTAQPDRMGARDVARIFWGRHSYVHLCLGLGIAAIGAYGRSTWTPAFLMRTYHLSAGEVGGYYSAMLGPATLLSIFLGGVLNDWLGQQRSSAPLWILAATFAVNILQSGGTLRVASGVLGAATGRDFSVADGFGLIDAFGAFQKLKGH